MKESEYTTVIDYKQWKSEGCRDRSKKQYSRLSKVERRAVRRRAVKYDLIDGRLYNRKTGKEVLTTGSSVRKLKMFHNKRGKDGKHGTVKETLEIFQRQFAFNVEKARGLLFRIRNKCEQCMFTYSFQRNSGAVWPLTKVMQNKACQKLGIVFNTEFKVEKLVCLV